MPRLRQQHQPNARPGSGRRLLAWLLFGAALYAVAEISAGLLIGHFFDWGRAEALLFLAFRPWLLLIAALRMAEARWRSRFTFYGVALLLAGFCESIFLVAMGATDPWSEMIRGWVAGALLVMLFDLMIQLGCRLAGRPGKLAATILLAVFLLVPGAPRPFERLLLGTDPPAQGPKPTVLVMTSLPIVWGESGSFDPASRPGAAWQALEDEFAPRPIDAIDSATLAGFRLMLIAQPRLLAPEELVALDEWVRGGGRILIFADPALAWPSALPPGDVRRPTATNMLTPLLSHWGLEVEPPARVESEAVPVDTGRGIRQLRVIGKGRLRWGARPCRRVADFIADCRIDQGRAIVVADADLLHDSTSRASPDSSVERHNRLSDNLPAVADWLDRLGGTERQPRMRPVQWVGAGARPTNALLVAGLPILGLLMLALLAARARPSRNSPTYPQPMAPERETKILRTKQE